MLNKGHVLLFSLLLLLAPGCKSDGGGQQPATTPPPASPPAPLPAADAAAAPSVAGNTTAPHAVSAAPPATAKVKLDACRLLTPDEIQIVQGDALKETKLSEQSNGPLATAQCFYTTASFVNSVSLTVTQKNPAAPRAQSLRKFWKENFTRAAVGKGARGRDRGESGERDEKEEKSGPPQRVAGVGEEAYWMGNSKVGALYVLKGDRYLRISVGGAGEPSAKIEKMKTLAQHALKRL